MTTRAIPMRWALLCFLAGGCASTRPASAPDDRYAVARMKNGPSLYETGRFAAVAPSSNGLHIEEGAIDRPPPPAAASAPAPARSRRLSSRHAHPSAKAERSR